MEKTMDKIVAVAKSRGFVYPGSEIYGGLANTWDISTWIVYHSFLQKARPFVLFYAFFFTFPAKAPGG